MGHCANGTTWTKTDLTVPFEPVQTGGGCDCFAGQDQDVPDIREEHYIREEHSLPAPGRDKRLCRSVAFRDSAGFTVQVRLLTVISFL